MSSQCREMDAAQAFQKLHEATAKEKKEFEFQSAENARIIQQLKDTIQEVNALTTCEQKYMRKEIKAHEMSTKQRCHQSETKLVEQRTAINNRTLKEHSAHEAIMEFILSQRQDLDFQIQDWMTKFEDDTEGKVQELEALRQKRSIDLDKFEEMVGMYEELERKVEEEQQNTKREMDDRNLTALKLKNVIKLQGWWRRLRVARNANPKKGGRKGSAKKRGNSPTKKSAKNK